jgi:regulator of PEP synthase PpsR (kinase-PPPase family)
MKSIIEEVRERFDLNEIVRLYDMVKVNTRRTLDATLHGWSANIQINALLEVMDVVMKRVEKLEARVGEPVELSEMVEGMTLESFDLSEYDRRIERLEQALLDRDTEPENGAKEEDVIDPVEEAMEAEVKADPKKLPTKPKGR